MNVKIEKPRYHSTEDGRWDYRVTIVFKSAAAFHDPNAPAAEEAIVKQLYPEQDKFKREEQRGFEILIAHWDVPIVAVLKIERRRLHDEQDAIDERKGKYLDETTARLRKEITSEEIHDSLVRWSKG